MQQSAANNSIPAADVDALIAAHDGDVALLYLYVLREGALDPEKAARALCRTLGEISSAAEKLRRMGLCASEAPGAPGTEARPEPKPLPADELPEYRTEDIVLRSKEDSGFSAVVQEAQKVLGHALSSPDLKRLFGIYDYLALPPEVILELLNHCVAVSQGRRPSMRFIEKEAYIWANREIFTFDAAEEYIRRDRLRREASTRAAALLGIRGRELSATEAKYISSWLDMGFDDSALSAAYDRTVTGAGAMKWGYMNKILQSWHAAGIHTAEEAERKDPRRAKSGAKPAARTAEKPVTIDELQKILEKM